VNKIGRIAISGFLFLGSAAHGASGPRQYDLICAGLEAGMEIDWEYTTTPNSKPERVRLAVDLDQLAWCHASCRTAGTLTVEPLKLMLQGGPPGLGPSMGFIDRQTGNYRDITLLPTKGARVLLVASYACAVAPFSGLPAKRF
jgi:hypothetical protein